MAQDIRPKSPSPEPRPDENGTVNDNRRAPRCASGGSRRLGQRASERWPGVPRRRGLDADVVALHAVEGLDYEAGLAPY